MPVLKSKESLLTRNLLKVVHWVVEVDLTYVFLGFPAFVWRANTEIFAEGSDF